MAKNLARQPAKKAATEADVFIIETLDPDDEGSGSFEGQSIMHVLRLHGKSPQYRYVRTRNDFEEALDEFAKSRARYLHLSCLGDPEGMVTTNGEEIDFDELAYLLDLALNGRRLFLSACSMVHQDVTDHLLTKTGCFSVVGPTSDVNFTTAAVFGRLFII
ncbi:hypothetical protein FHG66_16620 [Rubellimicrobium rubrum]|uniref:CHAT domain-containing protein n=1 Tax=Rubellimicrobium rubrum TaxID=2585369 RepID=A0A5C4MQ98_9RHOB|nr:hypothetical protein [Rubellimicrobium rubrum]TNC47496.1 hypothetical protein FHG66_16620 [Rubellimicrobium rubrum]